MSYLKRIGVFLGLCALLLLVLNWQYFLIQAKYYYSKPEPIVIPIDDTKKAEPNKLWITSLGIHAPVMYVEEADEDKFQIALRDGVVHYPNTAMPGKVGNVYIFGHSSDFPTVPGNYKTVFALLPKIKAGDMIEISDQDGKLYSYKTAETKIVSPTELHVLGQDHSKKQLTLQTSYPIGTALRRFLVIAYLEE